MTSVPSENPFTQYTWAGLGYLSELDRYTQHQVHYWKVGNLFCRVRVRQSQETGGKTSCSARRKMWREQACAQEARNVLLVSISRSRGALGKALDWCCTNGKACKFVWLGIGGTFDSKLLPLLKKEGVCVASVSIPLSKLCPLLSRRSSTVLYVKSVSSPIPNSLSKVGFDAYPALFA